MEAIRIRAKWENDDYICRGHILNGMSDSLFDVYTNVESAKELWDSLESKYMAEDSSRFQTYFEHGKDDLSLVQLGSHLRIEESLRAQDSDKGKGKEVAGPSVNMTKEVVRVPTRNISFEIWKCGKPGHFEEGFNIAVVVKRRTQMLVVQERGLRTVPKTKVDAITWWIDSGATTHVCKDRCWFKTYELVEDGSVLYMGDDHFAPVHGKGSFPDDSDSVYMSSSTVVNSLLWHARLGHVHYKRMLEMSKDELIPAIDENPDKCTTCMLTKITRQPFKSITRKSVILELIHSDLCDFHATPSLGNKKYVITFIDDDSRFCYVYLLHAKDEALDKFRIYKTEVELQQNDSIKTLRTDRGGEYYDLVFFQSVGIIHETTAPYTPQQNGVAERKNRALKEMVNSMLSYSGLSEGFWGEAMLTACYLLNRVPNKRNKTTPYELWYKKRPNLAFLRVWGCRAVVRLPDPKRKTLGEKGIDCIFVGYAEHSKAYSIEEDPRTYNEAMQSRDYAFWKEAIDNDIGSIMENNTLVIDICGGFYLIYPLVVTFRLQMISKEDESRWNNDKFKARFSGKGVIICLYVDDMLIFGTDQNQVDKTRKILSSKFSMKDMGEADVILGIKIKRENKEIVIIQSHYIEKILKKFNCEDCSLVSTPMDSVEKLKPNTGKPVDQLEYSKAIGCLMYAMKSTRPDIAYAIRTMNYGLSYVGYPSVLEAYSDASWINHIEDSSSTSGRVFLFGGALAVAGKEEEWLRNLIHEIPIWLKPIAPISI
ncbi:zinc finger, CCHC-type containing protein [Tanacetum coccineum]